MNMVRLGWLGIRFITPWLVRALAFTVRACLTAVVSLWIGVPNACDANANRWVTEAFAAGFPTLYTRYLYWAVYIVTLLVILFSWVIFAHVTVFLLSVVF